MKFAANKHIIRTWLSGLLLMIFLIAQIPYAALHHHETTTETVANSKHVGEVVKSTSDDSECQICSFHFVKDFLIESQHQLSLFTVLTNYHPTAQLSAQLFNLALKQLRAPPFQL